MTDVTTLLAGIKARATDALDYPGHATVEQSASDVPRLVAALEAVAGLHKREARWTHPEWTGSFRTRQDAVDCGDEADIDSFDVCAECGRIESEQLSESGEEWGYREGLWPCPTITAAVAALGGGE